MWQRVLCTQLPTLLCAYSHPEATRLTTMEVEVDELWTSTVTKIPTTSPATGLDSTALSWKMSPATLPGLICSPHADTQTRKNTFTHTHPNHWSQTNRVAKSNVQQDSRCLFSEHSKRSQMRLCSKLYSTTLVGRWELFCSDSLICQTSTGWVTLDPPRGQGRL